MILWRSYKETLKKRAWKIKPLKTNGAGGDRTRDLLNAIQARSQLRHSPNTKVSYTYTTLMTGDINAYTTPVKLEIYLSLHSIVLMLFPL